MIVCEHHSHSYTRHNEFVPGYIAPFHIFFQSEKIPIFFIEIYKNILQST